MSRYYNMKLSGVDIHAKPSNFWRRTFFRSLPYLTGDTIVIDVSVEGTYNVPVKSIYFIADYNGKQEAISPDYSINESKYVVNFDKMSKSGQYDIRVILKTSETGFEIIAWPTAPKVAVIHMIDNWKPLVSIANIVIGAVVGAIVTLIFLAIKCS